MLKLALFFFVVSLVAGFFSFSGLSSATAGVAKILFFVAVAIFVICIAAALFAGSLILSSEREDASAVIPAWLHFLSIACLALGVVCLVIITADIVPNPQHVGIMNVVWPVTALFGTLWVTWQYFRYGRLARDSVARAAMDHGEKMPSMRTPFPIMVANGALHCGSGCMLGDICAEWLVFLVPSVAVVFGWHWLFGPELVAAWVVDFLFAYAFGIVFQYFSIKPMRGLTPGAAIWAAIKADTLSLTSWQIGMYGFMAFANFYLCQHVLGVALHTDTPEFWFMMQIAMLCGFATAYPMNWLLIRTGVKEKM